MRERLRCRAKMVEDLAVLVERGGYGIKVKPEGLLKENLGRIKCAVCPKCGYTEMYIEDTTEIKKLV